MVRSIYFNLAFTAEEAAFYTVHSGLHSALVAERTTTFIFSNELAFGLKGIIPTTTTSTFEVPGRINIPCNGVSQERNEVVVVFFLIHFLNGNNCHNYILLCYVIYLL